MTVPKPHHRSVVGDFKRQRVLDELAATVKRGQVLTIAALARRADVSTKFIYDHPDLVAKVKVDLRDVADQLAGRSRNEYAVTVASLRSDLHNSRAQVRRLERTITALELRLSEYMGAEFEENLPPADRIALAADRDLQQKLAAVELNNVALKRQLEEREEDLRAIRTLNRQLMANVNRRGPEGK